MKKALLVGFLALSGFKPAPTDLQSAVSGTWKVQLTLYESPLCYGAASVKKSISAVWLIDKVRFGEEYQLFMNLKADEPQMISGLESGKSLRFLADNEEYAEPWDITITPSSTGLAGFAYTKSPLDKNSGANCLRRYKISATRTTTPAP